MSIAKSKTWQIDSNRVITGASVTAEMSDYWYQWKVALTSFALFPYTVAGSSDSVTAGMDGVDRWLSASNVVLTNTTGVKSWIVLACPVTGMQVLASMRVSNTTYGLSMWFAFSPGGLFTGGTTSAEPTATDQVTILNGINPQPWGRAIINNSVGAVLNVWRSNDGEATIWNYVAANAARSLGYMGRLENSRDPNLVACCLFAMNSTEHHDNLTQIAMVDQYTSTSSSATADIWVSAHRSYFGNLPVNNTAKMFVTAPMVNVSNTTTSNPRFLLTETSASHVPSANQITSEYDCPPVGAYCHTTGDKGLHGRFYDVRWAVDALATGDTFPADGTRQWVKMGPVVLPWDGSVPVLA